MRLEKELLHLLLPLYFFAALVSALDVSPGELLVLSPVSRLVTSSENVSLGTIGPGQTLELVADPFVNKGGKFDDGGRWDQLLVLKVPEGWSSEDSQQYDDPLQAKITVPANETDGLYEISAMAVDEGGKEQIGDNVSFSVLVNVTREVMSMGVSPKKAEVGAGQPASFKVTITNTGAASDAFEITSSGVPVWKYKKKVFVAAHSQKVFSYEIVSGEEKELEATIKVVSTSSQLIRKEEKVRLSVRTTLLSDFKAAGHGSLTFPVLEGPIYSLVGFLANLF